MFTPGMNREANALLPEEQPTYHKGFIAVQDRLQVHSFQIHSRGEKAREGMVTVGQCLTQQIPMSQR